MVNFEGFQQTYFATCFERNYSTDSFRGFNRQIWTTI